MSAPLPPLPDGVVLGSEFVFPTDPSTHLFFDDHPYNVIPVQAMANENGLNLKSVWCLPTRMTLYGLEGEPRIFDCAKDKVAYYELNRTDAPLFLRDVTRSIGTGITREIIQQIINKETEPGPKRTGRYFFDFDMLLNQFNGLEFSNLNGVDPSPDLFAQYAKYLFSDCIGVEPETSRLNLLKRMFEAIGHERIYIITANGTAKDAQRMNFIKLIQVLLPSFTPAHLVYAGSNKSVAIMSIVDSRSDGGARSKARKTRTKARKTRTKAKTSHRSRRSRKKSRRLS